MTTIEAPTIHPAPPLRDLIAEGRSVLEFLDDDLDSVRMLALEGAQPQPQFQAKRRRLVSSILAHEVRPEDPPHFQADELQFLVYDHAWKAEICDDPTLVEGMLSCLSPEDRETVRREVIEDTKPRARLEVELGTPGAYCDGCGRNVAVQPVVKVPGDDEFVYCQECISKAHQWMGDLGQALP